jgi:hypothetical protein
MKRFILLSILIFCFGCIHTAKMQRVISCSISDLTENWVSLLGKRVCVKGYPVYLGFRGYHYWNFILKDKKGNKIRCYEQRYRVEAWIIPVMILREAQKYNRLITVVGVLKEKALLELDWIEYEGLVIDTDELPSSAKGFFN